MKWYRLAAQLVIVIVLCASLANAEPRKSVQAENYVREETAEQFGVKGERSTFLRKRRDVAICTVTTAEHIFEVEDVSSVVFSEDKDYRFGAGDDHDLLYATDLYDPNAGTVYDVTPGIKVRFMPQVPKPGFEYFFMPTVPPSEWPTATPWGVRMLSTHSPFDPTFRGEWAYRWEKIPGGAFRATGPVFLQSQEGLYSLTGEMSCVVKAAPLRFLESRGDRMLVFRPAAAVGADASEEMVPYRKWDKVIVHHRFRMIPLASKEGRDVMLPGKLRDYLDRLPKE